MSKQQKIVISIAAVVVGVIGLLILKTKTQVPQRYLMAPVEIRGASSADKDPSKESPLDNTKVTAKHRPFYRRRCFRRLWLF